MSGWIKWYRSMQKWEWRDSPNHYTVFGFCLERANHAPNHYRGESIPTGSFTTSLDKICRKTGLTINQVRKALNDLKVSGEITKQSNRKRTMISIVNWGLYQTDHKQSHTKSTVKAHQKHSKSTTNKNTKKDKKERSIQLEFLDAELQEFIKDVTDLTRKKWLETYSEEVISDTLLQVYEYANRPDRNVVSVGRTMATFLKDKPKKSDNGLTPYELAVLNVREIPDDEL